MKVFLKYHILDKMSKINKLRIYDICKVAFLYKKGS